MANEVTKNPRTLLPISGRFAKAPVEDLGEGIKAALASLSIVGNVFGVNQRKTYTALPPQKARQIEVVVLRGARTQSKSYYLKPYGVEPNQRPLCWSSDSIVPDMAVEEKQSTQCNGCPKDTWVTAPNGRRQKMCGDHKRIAIVPADDIKNETFGGAMIFRVPQGSLANLDLYSNELKQMGIPYYAYTTFITLEIDSQKITRLKFEYGRPLTDEEADIVIPMRDEQRTIQIVADQVVPEENNAPPTTENGEPPKAAATVTRIAPAAAKPVTPGVQMEKVAERLQEAVTPSAKPAQAATINAAVARPATPPPTQRVVQTAPPPAEEPSESDEVEEAGQVPDELDGMFGNLFPGGEKK